MSVDMGRAWLSTWAAALEAYRGPIGNFFDLVGYFVKSLILIPHLVVLAVLVLLAHLLQYILWIFVLFGGQYPDWAYTFVGGTLRWYVRLATYLYGLSDSYPPFSFDPGLPGHADVMWEVSGSANRLWAIPVLGIGVKSIILIPHIIILYALGIVTGVLQLATWIPVLFTGQYPDWGISLIGGYIRWFTRVTAYFLGLTDRYPPFQLGA